MFESPHNPTQNIHSENYYVRLGVLENVTHEELKSAFRILVKKYHPDTSGYDSTNDMIRLREAYKSLLSGFAGKEKMDTETKSPHAGTMTDEEADIALKKLMEEMYTKEDGTSMMDEEVESVINVQIINDVKDILGDKAAKDFTSLINNQKKIDELWKQHL